MLVPYNVDVPMDRWPVANWALIVVTISRPEMGERSAKDEDWKTG